MSSDQQTLRLLCLTAATRDERLRLVSVLKQTPGTHKAALLIGHLLRACIPGSSTAASGDTLFVVYRCPPLDTATGSDDGGAGAGAEVQVDVASIAADRIAAVASVGLVDPEELNPGGVCNLVLCSPDSADTRDVLHVILDGVRRRIDLSSVAEGSFVDLMVPGLPVALIPVIESLPVTFNWIGDAYSIYKSNGEPKRRFHLKMGDSWVDANTGETFVLDTIMDSDIPTIMSHMTVPYNRAYLDYITKTAPFGRLNCVIRSYPAGTDPVTASQSPSTLGEPVSWGLRHYELSLGLLATKDSHRGRGLAARAVEVLTDLARSFLADEFGDVDIVPSIAFIKYDNHASRSVMQSCGYTLSETGEYKWVGVGVRSIPPRN
ncbi:hypothetical protein BC831DRAFT_449003 [Entophlyctis helioformis]|nr:hypothetical protein BC831DRAFT_449003 [Entophlyctis helioformis]